MSDWIIVGGGFRGIICAHFLRKAGCNVHLVERAPFLGGVHYSDEWNGFYLDKGCHLFDNDSDETTELLLEIMGGEYVPVQVRYAAVTEGGKSEGLAVPDLSTLDIGTRAKILYEVVAAAAEQEQQRPASLMDVLNKRFGPTAAGYLAKATMKMFRVHPNTLDPLAFKSTPFGRVRIVDDAMSEIMKQSPRLDDRMAASAQDDPLKYYRDTVTRHSFRNFYPAKGGLRAFCDNALAHLHQLGVNIVLGSAITEVAANDEMVRIGLSDGSTLMGDHLAWTIDSGILSQMIFEENPLSDLVHPVPMILYYFVLSPDNVGTYTYIHDFTVDNLVFRASSPGIYGGQIKQNGTTYICSEVTAALESEEWATPESFTERVWDETVRLGVAAGEAPMESYIQKTPVSYKAMKKGYSDVAPIMRERLNSHSERLVIMEDSSFSKKQIIDELHGLITV